MFKISSDSVCSTCDNKATEKDSLTCRECECVFHAICPNTKDNKDIAICNKTFLGIFLQPSTKPNFTWACDTCLTKEESDKVATLTQKITELAKSQETENTKLTTQISSLTESVTTLTDQVKNMSLPSAPVTNTVWDNTSRLQKVKSALVVKPDQQGNKVSIKAVRKMVTDKGIPVDSVVESENGEMYVNLPDEESRDMVSQLIEESHTANPVVKLKSKLPQLSIMGLTAKEMKKGDGEVFTREELEADMIKQNKSLAPLIENGSVFKVVYIKPPVRQKEFYTVVMRVSPDIRTLIKKLRDKIHIGLKVHNIVDRFYVKRCNRCQEFGHYADKCRKSDDVCGFCANQHKSDDCPDKNKPYGEHKCHNCKGSNNEAPGHPAFWTKCPAYKAQQKKLENSICFDYSNLNSI